jgi:hypothetical protein
VGKNHYPLKAFVWDYFSKKNSQMSKGHFKSNTIFSENKSLNVDKENGIIKSVCIVQFGANKNRTFFSEKYLHDFVIGANEIKQGVKSRYGHPNMCSTTLGKYIGRYKNFSFRKTANNKSAVFGDLYLDEITKKTQVEGQGISMFEYITEMAENNPDMFGNSIHIPAPKFEKELVDVDGKKYESHIFNGVLASDLVDSPAATDSLFADTNDLGIAVTDFLDNNPMIFSVIEKDPAIIEDFFERYVNYSNNYKSNFNMSFLDKLKKKFSNNSFDIEETTATGSIVKVVTEDENPKVGDKVVNEDGTPVADGDLVIKNGATWVITEGAISEIKEPDTPEGGDEEPTMSEVMQGVNDLANSFNAFQTQYQIDLKENQSSIELVADEVEKFNTKFNTLARSVKSKDYKVPDAEETGGKNKKFSESTAEKWKSKRKEKRKINKSKRKW